MTAKRTAGTLLVMVLPLLTYTSASAHDSPDAEESEPAESSVEPTPDDEVVVTLPRGVADPTNTQVGPDITASELAREGHFHTAEVDVGAEPEGVEVSVEEQLADTVLDARPDDYWVDGGPASPQVDSVATGTASLATAASYMNIYMQAHPDDEASMFASIDSYGNNSGYHKVFAILTRGEQSNYCDFNGSSVQPNELDPNPIPEGKWRSSCDTARINSYMNFFRDAGSRYTYIDRSYSYYGEVSPDSS